MRTLQTADTRINTGRVKRNILGNLFHSLTGKIEQFVKKLIYKVETAWESQERNILGNLLHSIGGSKHGHLVKQLIQGKPKELSWATYFIALVW
jgi:hypothetical protein